MIEPNWMEYCSLIFAMLQGESGAEEAAIDWLQENLGRNRQKAERSISTWKNFRPKKYESVQDVYEACQIEGN